jgi:hypothetical protein
MSIEMGLGTGWISGTSCANALSFSVAVKSGHTNITSSPIVVRFL